MKRRLLSFLLCICMVITMLPATAYAALLDNEPATNREILAQLEAICGMDSLGDLCMENAEAMRELGMSIPEAGIAGRKCTRHDTIVMNYHLEKLLAAYRFLAELIQAEEQPSTPQT